MNYPPSETNFLTEAAESVINCRYMLKWTYVYAYFCIFDTDEKEVAKKSLFEYS